MVADISDHGPGPDLLQAIARQAARASRQQLTVLLVLATLGSIAAGLTVTYALAVALTISALCAATAALALWELWRRVTVHPTRPQAVIQKGIATIGVLLWFVSGMALLLVLLGQPWQL
jgi:hypothetical protein